MRKQIAVMPALAFPVCDSYLYTCILGPRDCRCPRGAPGAGLWALLGSPHTVTIFSLFRSPNVTGACQREWLQANVTLRSHAGATSLATSTCVHTCADRRAVPGPSPSHPRGRAGGKPRTGLGWALPGRARGVTAPAPAPEHPGTARLQPLRAGGRVSQSPCAQPQPPCARSCPVCPGPAVPHVPHTQDPMRPGLCALCSLRPLSPCAWIPYLWDPRPPHCWDSTSLGPHTPGTPIPTSPGLHTSETPYPGDHLLPGAPIPTAPCPVPAAFPAAFPPRPRGTPSPQPSFLELCLA